MTRALAPHEALELHEVLRTEALSATKAQAMLPMVGDADLKALMQDSLQRKLVRIERMREFAARAAH